MGSSPLRGVGNGHLLRGVDGRAVGGMARVFRAPHEESVPRVIGANKSNVVYKYVLRNRMKAVFVACVVFFHARICLRMFFNEAPRASWFSVAYLCSQATVGDLLLPAAAPDADRGEWCDCLLDSVGVLALVLEKLGDVIDTGKGMRISVCFAYARTRSIHAIFAQLRTTHGRKTTFFPGMTRFLWTALPQVRFV